MARKADPTIRGRLLAAARTEFSQEGLDGARISSITSRAGISKGAFYLHFKTKEHAFEEVASDFFGTIYRRMEELDRLLESSSTDLVAIQEQILERDVELFEFLWNQRAFALILFEGAGSSRHCHLIEAFAKQVQTQIAVLLDTDRRHGRLRPDLDIQVCASFIAGGYDRYARVLLASESKPDIRSDLRQLQRLVNLGLMPLEVAATLPSSLMTLHPPTQLTRPMVDARPRRVEVFESGEFPLRESGLAQASS
jgi:AcrR family transcriptional regulator